LYGHTAASAAAAATLQRRFSIVIDAASRRLLLLICVKTLDRARRAACTIDFNTVGIKEIVEQGGRDMHPGRDTDSDHIECYY